MNPMRQQLEIWRLVLTARNRGESVFDTLLAQGMDEAEARTLATADEPLYEPEPETEEAIYQHHLSHSALPSEYARCTFDSFRAFTPQQRKGKMLAFSACRLFVEASGRSFALNDVYARLKLPPPDENPVRSSLVLYGPMGVGKTGLAASVANVLMAKGKPVIYTRAQQVITDIWDTYKKKDQRGPSGRTRSEIVAYLRAVPVLIIDEMGGEHDGSKDRRDIMEEILRPRCSAELPVLITTNHTPRSFEGEWGGKTTDKLLERAHWIPMGGDSLRQKWQPSEAV
jgi:DNA replication protein DnaC